MKMAILGAGGIAHQMAKTIVGLPSVEAYAIGARDLGRAQAFADTYGFTKAYGSYEEMLADDAIDLVYVATPHSHHYEHVKLCFSYGKNVICEKAFTMNATQAKELIAISEEKHLFLTEAIWTRYLPMRQTINEVMASGVIGEITSVSANLGYNIDGVKRIVDPALAGGALLDLGVYVLNLASMILGDDVKEIHSAAVMAQTGVDLQNTIMITYNDGKMASLYTTASAISSRMASINGRKGHIEVQNINNYEEIRVYDEQYELVETIKAPAQITGFEYQVLASEKAIAEGALECPEMPHATIILMMEQMDEIRAQWGFVYPGE